MTANRIDYPSTLASERVPNSGQRQATVPLWRLGRSRSGQRRWPRSPARIELDIDAASDGVLKREQTQSHSNRQRGSLDPALVDDPASRNLYGLRLPATTEAIEALFLIRVRDALVNASLVDLQLNCAARVCTSGDLRTS